LSLRPSGRFRNLNALAIYALTVFTGAFLLFQVQPLIAKYILPWFGGGPGVWTTCMLFFQVLLLGGYAYAHFTSRWLKPRTQAILHLVLLGAALALLPITPAETWKPSGTENPTLRILALLTVCLGLPYFVLSSTGPLVQQWVAQSAPSRSPYRLYALSNIGSLLALLSFPFFFETHFTRHTQAQLWGWGLVGYVLCCAFCVLKMWRVAQARHSDTPLAHPSTSPITSPAQPSNPPPLRYSTALLWLLLPACASVDLLATTNKICQDIAVIPFLWVVPLALYLLSFIICFDSPRWYVRLPWSLAFVVTTLWITWLLPMTSKVSMAVLLGVYCVGLFLCCMVCHGELYRLRPDPRRLTSFYLMIAAGGALGGLFVAVVAPLIFNDYSEMPCGLFLCALLFILASGRSAENLAPLPRWRRLAGPWLWAGLLLLGLGLWFQSHQFPATLVSRSRNFYGVLRVAESGRDDPKSHHFALFHGHTWHGLQFVSPSAATLPTLYYNPWSGAGVAYASLPRNERRIGVVGLGVGTLAAYSRTNDYFRFYEINPEVQRLALTYFSYLAHCHGKVEVALGDARLTLAKEPPQGFDLLALDAFSGDAIPVHLLTREAFALYDRHLKTNGVIAVHISNDYLDLEPVLVNVARELHYHLAVIESHPPPAQWYFKPTIWVLLARRQDVLDSPLIQRAARPPEPNCSRVSLWTDDFASLFQVVR